MFRPYMMNLVPCSILGFGYIAMPFAHKYRFIDLSPVGCSKIIPHRWRTHQTAQIVQTLLFILICKIQVKSEGFRSFHFKAILF